MPQGLSGRVRNMSPPEIRSPDRPADWESLYRILKFTVQISALLRIREAAAGNTDPAVGCNLLRFLSGPSQSQAHDSKHFALDPDLPIQHPFQYIFHKSLFFTAKFYKTEKLPLNETMNVQN